MINDASHGNVVQPEVKDVGHHSIHDTADVLPVFACIERIHNSGLEMNRQAAQVEESKDPMECI